MAVNSQLPDSGDTLQNLALRAQRGDRSAFERLHHRYEAGLRRILLRRTGGDVQRADELLHDTWVAVWEALQRGRYDPTRAAISTFIYAVAHKRWLQHLRSVGQTPRSAEATGLLAGLADRSENPDAVLQAGELLDALRACLHATDTPFSLTSEEREIVSGLADEDSERSLAKRLGLAASTIHARKLQAYRKLRQCLAAKGFPGDARERGADLNE